MEPHMLMMSATPIPRTLAMSYYADLDVSVIDELPPGRTPIVTKLIADSRKDEVIARIGAQVAAGRQVYWVCPLIEESEALDLSNATATHADLSEALPGVHGRPAALAHAHGREEGRDGAVHQRPDGRAGQHHGDRGGRGRAQCLAHGDRARRALWPVAAAPAARPGGAGRGGLGLRAAVRHQRQRRVGETAKERLRAMAETNDGFEIARRDLEIRGPGEFLGARQSGDALLRFADLATDTHLLEWARELAPQMLDRHPELAAKHVARWLGGKSDYLKA
jgi:ATP-dependent DNA helicase RecG